MDQKFIEFIERNLPSLAQFGLKILLSLIVFYVGLKVVRWLIKILRASLEKASVDAGVIQFLCSLGRMFLYAILVFSIATNFGVTESSIAALLGSAGITLGVGLQGGLANLAGGIMILIFKPFLVGDYIIESGSNLEGTVTKIEICYTTLSTVDNKRIVTPNGTLSNNSITNVTAKDERRLEIKVTISYQADIQKAKGILERLLKEDPDILSDQEMVVFLDELAASWVVIGFRAWVATDNYWPAKWRLNEKIKESFDREGIELAYPQMDIHIKKQ